MSPEEKRAALDAMTPDEEIHPAKESYMKLVKAPLRKAHWADDPRLRREADLQDGRHALLQPLPDRTRMTREMALEIERGICRCGLFSARDQRFLLTVLEHTDGHTHVCYRHRNFLLEKAEISRRWSQKVIEKCRGPEWKPGMPGLILTPLQYNRKHPDLRRKTTEWMEGCLWLRWEVVSHEELDRAARIIQGGALHSAPTRAVAIAGRGAVPIAPTRAVAIAGRGAVHSAGTGAVAIAPTGDPHSAPSICGVKEPPSSPLSTTDQPLTSSPSSPKGGLLEAAAATSGQDSRGLADDSSAAATPAPAVPEREAGEGGRAPFMPEPTLTPTRADAVAWWEFYEAAMNRPRSAPPSLTELAPVFDALYLEPLVRLQWVVVASRKGNRNHPDRTSLWSPEVLLRPASIRRWLNFARGEGWDLATAPDPRDAPRREPTRPEATSPPPVDAGPSEAVLADLRRQGFMLPAHLGTPEQTASVFGENSGKDPK